MAASARGASRLAMALAAADVSSSTVCGCATGRRGAARVSRGVSPWQQQQHCTAYNACTRSRVQLPRSRVAVETHTKEFDRDHMQCCSCIQQCLLHQALVAQGVRQHPEGVQRVVVGTLAAVAVARAPQRNRGTACPGVSWMRANSCDLLL